MAATTLGVRVLVEVEMVRTRELCQYRDRRSVMVVLSRGSPVRIASGENSHPKSWMRYSVHDGIRTETIETVANNVWTGGG